VGVPWVGGVGVEALSEKYSAVIQVDHSYVERREDV